MVEKSTISVILNGYKRPHLLKEQADSIFAQSESVRLYVWQNTGDITEDVSSRAICSLTNYNFGVWARFAFALNCNTEYVCVFDDDTIPGEHWLKNCKDTIIKNDGLLGTVGVTFNDLTYRNYSRYGWVNPNESAVKTDIVGHSWFFRREWLGDFWREGEPPEHNLSAEDIHFSYSIQKYRGLSTYVPPHPESDKRLWGSNPDKAIQYGVDSNAISCNYHASHFGKNLERYYQKGFRFLNFK